MWPERGEALSRTIDAEAAVADLYAEALRRWAPDARAAVLPALTAATGDLPPDPEAVTQAQGVWEQHAEEIILAGLLLLWAVAFVEAAKALGVALPLLTVDLDRDRDGGRPFDAAAVAIVAGTTDATPAEVTEWATRIHEDDAVRATVTDFVDQRRPQVFATTGTVAHQLAAVARDADTLPKAADTPLAVTQRAAVSAALDVGSPEMRDLARREGYQAAGVLNHAVLAAAAQQNANLPEDEREELQATWICTLDSKTRASHWAADGQRVPLGGTFTVGQDQLRFPCDPLGSPAEVKNCRCRVGVLAANEPIPDEVDRHTERLDGRDSVAINRDGRTQAEEIERRRDAGNIRARDDEDGIGRVAAGGWTAPSEQEYGMADDTEDETFLTFTDALFAVTGTPTSDGRMLAADINLTFRDTPMPLQWCEEMEGGHYGSVTVGVIESISYSKGEVRGSGYMLNSENALKAIDLISHGVCNPSVDLGGDDFEMVAMYEDGTVVTEENYDPDRKIYATTTTAEVMATTIVAIPAFGETRIALNEQRESRAKTLVAAAIAEIEPRVRAYDPALFEDPKLDRPTPPTMNNETGRIYGHLAEFGKPYRGGSGESTPRNRNGYANFHTSQVQLTNGKQLSVGRLTVEGGHAPTQRGVTVATARAHYDNVCTAFGLVRVGEDRHGIWFSGVPAPGVDPDVFQAGMTAPLSGDWRDCGQGLDMIGAHAVNTPGFPIYSAVTGPGGRDLALVASFSPTLRSKPAAFTLDREALKTLLTEVVETVDQRHADRQAAAADRQAAALAHRARAEAALAQAHAAIGQQPTPRERVAELLAGSA